MAAHFPEACAINWDFLLVSSALRGWGTIANSITCLFIRIYLEFSWFDSTAVLTFLAELRGAPTAPRWEDGNDALAEARASLLDAAPQTPESRVWLAAIGVFHAVDLAADALHHVAACCTNGPAKHVIHKLIMDGLYHRVDECEGRSYLMRPRGLSDWMDM